MINVLQDLRIFRQRSNFFTGKEGVITVRDLIKWGNRPVSSILELGIEGYCILAERLRTCEERTFIKKVLEKNLKIEINTDAYYQDKAIERLDKSIESFPFYIQMNQSFKRMAVLTMKCMLQGEPVLLIGETGCGKTTLC